MILAVLQCDDQVDLMGIVGRMSASPILLCTSDSCRSSRQTVLRVGVKKVCLLKCKFPRSPWFLVLGVVVPVNLGPLCFTLLSQSKAV